jgi:hypothetical protein
MRNLIETCCLLMVAVTALNSCKKDVKTLDTNVTPVSALVAPSNQASFTLQSGGTSVVFQWSASTTTSNLVLYEVAFDKAGGDFSHPVYKIMADGAGVQTQATIPQDTLNKIASIAGIASSATGGLKWAIMASVAASVKLSGVTQTFSVTRPAGFAVLPSAMYVTGTATEGGADINKAIAMKQISTGQFESYTSLQPGTYQFSDKPDGSGTKYYLDANGVLQLGSSATTVSATKKAYRIYLDFSVATSKVVAIDSIGLYMSAYNAVIGKLNYTGNGTWENAKIPVTFYQFSWGRDQRYKFILHTSAGDEYWGSSMPNNVDPAGQAAGYFYLTLQTNDQWNNTYKFPAAADTHNVKVDVYFQASRPYTHTATAFN